jgi:hypothetical protein
MWYRHEKNCGGFSRQLSGGSHGGKTQDPGKYNTVADINGEYHTHILKHYELFKQMVKKTNKLHGF